MEKLNKCKKNIEYCKICGVELSKSDGELENKICSDCEDDDDMYEDFDE